MLEAFEEGKQKKQKHRKQKKGEKGEKGWILLLDGRRGSLTLFSTVLLSMWKVRGIIFAKEWLFYGEEKLSNVCWK